jgi:hypothetical protein
LAGPERTHQVARAMATVIRSADRWMPFIHEAPLGMLTG